MNFILLFGMPGGAELFFIVLVIIMLFGSKKIPELARGLGKGIREIKNATGEIQREIRESAKDINDKVNIERQVKDLIKEDKEKKESSVDNSQSLTEKNLEKKGKSTVKTEETIIQKKSITNNEKEDSQSQTVKRKSPYAKEVSKNISEEV